MSHWVISMTSLSSDRSIMVEEGADVIFYNGVVVDGVVLLSSEGESDAGATGRLGSSGGSRTQRINVAGRAVDLLCMVERDVGRSLAFSKLRIV
jgi:hypothetical protein